MSAPYIPLALRQPPDPTPVRPRPDRDRAHSALDAAHLVGAWIEYRDALRADLVVLRRIAEEEGDKFRHGRGEYGNAWGPHDRKRQASDEAEHVVRHLRRQATGL